MKKNSLFLILLFSTLLGGYPFTFLLPVAFYLFFPLLFSKRYSKRNFPYEFKKIVYIYSIILFIGILSFFLHFTSVYNLILYITFSSIFISYPLCTYLNYGYKLVIHNLNMFTCLQIIVIILQIGENIVKYRTINLFSISMSIGDTFKGTFSNSTLTCMFLFIAFIIYYDQYCTSKSKKIRNLLIVLVILAILTSANTNIILFVLAITLSGLFNAIYNKKFWHVGGVALAIFIGINVFSFIQPNNVKYIQNFIDETISSESSYQPRKIAYIRETLNNFIYEEWDIPIIGVGGGNYSSKAAMIASNEYINIKNFSFPDNATSKYTEKYIVPKWNKYILSIGHNDGIANQPFSSIMSILGETGVIGLTLIIYIFVLIYKLEFKYSNKNNMLKGTLTIFVFFMLMIDNYLEYASFISMFWLGKYYFISKKRVE